MGLGASQACGSTLLDVTREEIILQDHHGHCNILEANYDHLKDLGKLSFHCRWCGGTNALPSKYQRKMLSTAWSSR
jgi:hypothetical protein